MEAFGVDNELSTIDLGTVTLAEALELARERQSHAHEIYDFAEDCLAATRVGFSKDGDDDFLEIDFTKDLVDVRYERRSERSFLGFRSRRNETVRLGSIQRFESLLADYFNRDRESFEAVFKDLPGRRPFR